MNGPAVAVVRTGTANTASVLAALTRAGARAELVDDGDAIARARAVVLPGVGAFGQAMSFLGEVGRGDAVRERIGAGRATLCICLGLQVLGSSSEESPGVSGLGVFDAPVTRFGAGRRVPHIGWNRVVPDGRSRFVDAGFAYFANSYKLDGAPPGWAIVGADHAGPFVGALERGSVLACQFHPELSGAWGLGVIRRWLGAAGA